MSMFVEHPIYRGYLFYDDGTVVSLKWGKWRKLKPYADGPGYARLSIGTDRMCIRVHRVIMELFKGPSDLYVDHINGIKMDNRLENLEYVTASENVRRGYELSKRQGNYIKYTDEQINHAIGLKGTMTGTEAARITGISMWYIYDLWTGNHRKYRSR